MSTKAVHLKFINNLNTETFIAALKRFFSKRGKSNVIFSDNVTNFVGAKNELRQLYDLVSSDTHKETMKKWLSKQEVTWKFILSRASYFGGIWERTINL